MSDTVDRWLVISFESPSDELSPVLSEGLVASGGTAVIEDGAMLTTWLLEPADPDVLIEQLRARLEADAGQRLELRIETREAEDWLAKWRTGLDARRVGDRLVVTPSWIRPATHGPDDIVITIDPQMAFGTGEHASTRGCLRLLERTVRPGSTVLDVGAGSAILAIAAARLGAASVLAVEADESAIENAGGNIASNHCTDAIRLIHAEVDNAWLARRDRTFETIVANVLSGVLRPLLPGFRKALANGGHLILGGILTEEAEAVVDDAVAAGLEPDLEDVEAGWWSGRFTAR